MFAFCRLIWKKIKSESQSRSNLSPLQRRASSLPVTLFVDRQRAHRTTHRIISGNESIDGAASYPVHRDISRGRTWVMKYSKSSYLHSNCVIFARSTSVRHFVRSSVTKCTIIYCEQTGKSRSAIFCTNMHVDKVHSHSNVHPNRQRPWTLERAKDIGKYIPIERPHATSYELATAKFLLSSVVRYSQLKCTWPWYWPLAWVKLKRKCQSKTNIKISLWWWK